MGATVQARGAMYKAVAQSVLLYSSKSWVVSGYMLKVLEGFHHRSASRITGITAKQGAGGEWDYPSVLETMKSAGLHPIGVYIRRRKATIAERSACHPIYELCKGAEQMPGTRYLVQ